MMVSCNILFYFAANHSGKLADADARGCQCPHICHRKSAKGD
jgi:hypothetical protein